MILERYDRIIWRANGTLILLACVGTIVVCSIVGYKLLKDMFGTRQVHDIVNIDDTTKKIEHLKLGYFERLKGTTLILVPLTLEQEFEKSYYSKNSYTRARNYMVFNMGTKESYWIWDDNSALILNEHKVHNQLEENRSQKTIGIAFEIVQSDSNSDGTLSSEDKQTLHYFDIDSRKTITLADGLDRTLGIQQFNREVLFFYSKAGRSYSKSLNLQDLSTSSEKAIDTPKSR